MNYLPLTRKTEPTVCTLKQTECAVPDFFFDFFFKGAIVVCIVQTSVCERVPYLPKKLGTLPALRGQIL